MTPYFSIIVPLYNKEKHILETLNSVWSQSFSSFELIVVNDGSTDGSLEKVKSVNDSRLKLFSIENQGVSHARNYGISKATSDFMVFLDADDFWFEHHLQDLKHLYEEFPNCGMFCKAYDKKDGSILMRSKFKNIPINKAWKGIIKDYFDSSVLNSIAWTSAVMVPISTFEKVGYFDDVYNSGEDTDLWIRIALEFPVAFSNKVSAIHNLDSDHKITDQKLSTRNHIDFNKFQNQEKTNKSLKKYLDLNRYSIAMQYKLEEKKALAETIFKSIDGNNLTTIQKLLFSLPNYIVRQLLKSRNFLRRFHIDLRLFR